MVGRSIGEVNRRGRPFLYRTILAAALVAGALIAHSAAQAYPTYRSSGQSNNCVECHDGFVGGFSAPLHGPHAAALNNDCVACHQSPGSTPVDLDSSNGGQLPGCTGCHAAVGLRLHHTNAGVPGDSFGLACLDCHPDDPAPDPENFRPVYYGARAPGLDPCDGSEELVSSRTVSLDNDGDLLYDAADPDCVAAECGNGLAEGDEECDDGNTVDGDCCAADCSFETAGSVCDDGQFCTSDDACDGAGQCIGGAANTCSDGVLCTVDSCDEATDTCENNAEDVICVDESYCNGDEFCDPVADCQFGTPVDCDDGDICTDDSCSDDASACQYVFDPGNDVSCLPPCPDNDLDGYADCSGAGTPPTAYATGDPAGRTNRSSGGLVAIRGAASRSASVPVVAAECDASGLVCGDCDDTAAAVNPGANEDCGNGVDDNCDAVVDGDDPGCAAGVCGNAVLEDGEDCDDGNISAGDCCAADCTWEPAGASCADGTFCTVDDTCDGLGRCMAGPLNPCDDGVTCTTDSCDLVADACVNTPADQVCDDGRFCNGVETCDALEDCQGGQAFDCDDGVGCTVDSCDEATDGCVYMPDDGACDDGAFCNGIETCDAVADCRPGNPVDCDDGDVCTDDSCNEGSDACVNTFDEFNDPSCEPPPNVHRAAETDCGICHDTTDLRPLHGNNCGACHVNFDFSGTILGRLGTWDFECAQCHNPAVPETGGAAEPTKGHRCVACHARQMSTDDIEDVHEEHIDKANCVVCHGEVPDPRPVYGQGAFSVCATCHEGGRTASIEKIHEEHVPNGLNCQECHTDGRPPVDVVWGPPVGGITRVCQLCHDDEGDKAGYFGFGKDGDDGSEVHRKHVKMSMDCGACHLAANLQDDRQPMLPIDDTVRAQSRMGNPCYLCHDDVEASGSRKVHEEHVAEQWQWCFNCHMSGDGRPLGLMGPVTEPADSCALCHGDEQFNDSTPFSVHKEHAERNKCYACHQGVPQLVDWPLSWLGGEDGDDDDDDGDDDYPGDGDDDDDDEPGYLEIDRR